MSIGRAWGECRIAACWSPFFLNQVKQNTMYARKKGIIADVHRLNGSEVIVILKSGNKRKWKGGNGDIELIEFGSLNPENDNYREGGKVLRRI